MSHAACLWITPKIFPDLANPAPQVVEFFARYAPLLPLTDNRLVVNMCTGNGDHILAYRGTDGLADTFDWARYNNFQMNAEHHWRLNAEWLQRVREGGEVSYNPANAGPCFMLSDQIMDYQILAGIYAAFRAEAQRRKIELTLVEYLEPGPEFCHSRFKTEWHPESAPPRADAGGAWVAGILDVCAPLNADTRCYAAYPTGIPAGLLAGDFAAAQTGTFVRDFGLDGVFLGNQFGLVGFWNPENAPPATPERRSGIVRAFSEFRRQLGEKRIYWMDSYWPADVEIKAWAMSDPAYACMDAVMVSNFAVIIERTQMIPNLDSRVRVSQRLEGRAAPWFSFDFFDPWYWYRVHLDLRKDYLHQRSLFRKEGHKAAGISFFANDTFGHLVPEHLLAETIDAIREGWNLATLPKST